MQYVWFAVLRIAASLTGYRFLMERNHSRLPSLSRQSEFFFIWKWANCSDCAIIFHHYSSDSSMNMTKKHSKWPLHTCRLLCKITKKLIFTMNQKMTYFLLSVSLSRRLDLVRWDSDRERERQKCNLDCCDTLTLPAVLTTASLK